MDKHPLMVVYLKFHTVRKHEQKIIKSTTYSEGLNGIIECKSTVIGYNKKITVVCQRFSI